MLKETDLQMVQEVCKLKGQVLLKLEPDNQKLSIIKETSGAAIDSSCIMKKSMKEYKAGVKELVGYKSIVLGDILTMSPGILKIKNPQQDDTVDVKVVGQHGGSTGHGDTSSFLVQSHQATDPMFPPSNFPIVPFHSQFESAMTSMKDVNVLAGSGEPSSLQEFWRFDDEINADLDHDSSEPWIKELSTVAKVSKYPADALGNFRNVKGLLKPLPPYFTRMDSIRIYKKKDFDRKQTRKLEKNEESRILGPIKKVRPKIKRMVDVFRSAFKAKVPEKKRLNVVSRTLPSVDRSGDKSHTTLAEPAVVMDSGVADGGFLGRRLKGISHMLRIDSAPDNVTNCTITGWSFCEFFPRKCLCLCVFDCKHYALT